MKKYLLIAISIFIIGNCFGQAPSWAWAQRANMLYYGWGNGVTTDFNGNIFVTGGMGELGTFGQYGFLLKYNNLGTPLFTKQLFGNQESECLGICSDLYGNIYVTGYFWGAGGNAQFDSLSLSAPNYGIFIVKYDNYGNVLWARGQNGSANSSNTFGNSICNGSNGDIIVAGNYQGDSTLIGSFVLHSPSISILLLKYDINGNVLFAKEARGGKANNICTDNNNNIYVTGTFYKDTLNFGTTQLIKPHSDSTDIFIVKYSPSGNVIWAISEGGTSVDEGNSIIYQQGGNIYLNGRFESSTITLGSTTLYNTGQFSNFLAKYDTAGNLLWAKQIPGEPMYHNWGPTSKKISLDGNGNIYYAGYFYDSTFTFGSSVFLNDSAGESDIKVLKFDPSGNPLFGITAGSNEKDAAYCITSDLSGNAIISGETFGGNNPTVFGSHSITTLGVFVAKLDMPAGISEINNQQLSIEIYPNPFTSLTTITFSEEQKNTSLTVTDVLGNILLQSTIINQQSKTLNMSGYAKGVYFVRVVSAGSPTGNVVNRKIVLQ